ncbi:MAG: 2-C-methyl-D-erythritol 4-phosphate cytidylyltransferase [Clostridiales bacterium]|nr:2-C-methyl-D-erythritol 4-phosphate cytidylyltransferase [Clostridiales bacterium]
MKCAAIILAAGQGKRMKSSQPKQFLMLGDKPLLYYALQAFEQSDRIGEIVLVAGEEYLSYCQENIIEKYHFQKVSHIIAGGQERYDSVYQGLSVLSDVDYVFIHDGARPFVSGQLIERGYQTVLSKKACIAAVRVKDTIKVADSAGKVQETPDRSSLWQVQTPQIFSYPLIKNAYDSLQETDKQGITDDAMVVEQMADCPVFVFEGDYRNIKITTPEDLEIGEVFVKDFAMI